MSDEQPQERTNIPILSRYKDVPVNGSIPLYEGSIRLEWTGGISELEGTIVLDLQGNPRVRFNAVLPEFLVLVEVEGTLRLEPMNTFSSAPYLLRRQVASSVVGKTNVSGIIYGKGITVQELKADGKPESVGRIEFHLMNFLEYRGDSLTKVNGDDWQEWLGRVSFSMGDWEITLDQFQDVEDRLREAQAVNGNVLTHVGMLCRKDNRLFAPDDARRVLEALYWFLSFMNGSLCAFVAPTGLRHLGRPLWQQWGLYSSTPVTSHSQWFSENATDECFLAADKFYACWCDESKREWLNLAIGLYLASNHNNGGVELALANSQIMIELLTWVALQGENSLMSNESFEKLPAADKIRALLFWLGISVFIPEASKVFKSAFPQSDAPEAAVKIRNLVIHPTKSNRSQRSQISNDAIYD